MPNFFKRALFRTLHIIFKRSICITGAVLFVAALVAAFSSMNVALAEEDLYSASSPGMGSTQPNFTITEIKREPRISTLKIPGFRDRSAGASRWMMCAYTDLAIKRGYKYWAALYPRDSSDVIQLGFLNSKDEEVKTVLGSQFAGDGVIVSAVGDFAAFCGIKNASSADQEQKDKKRFHLLSAKAAQGNADAQSDLGLMYADGQGTPQDYAEAYKWYNLAASQGQEGASAYRDKLALSMTPEQIAEGHRRSSAFVPRNDSPTQIQSQTPTSKPEKPVVQPAGKADDPFTGMWRVTSQLIMTPTADGISIQQNGGKPIIATYGKDYLMYPHLPVMANTVRVDDHTLKTTSLMDGKVTSIITETVSPDGQHYIKEYGLPPELSQRGVSVKVEYDRVGPVPSGDAFFGTWRQTSPLDIYTIKVEGETFTLINNGRPNFAVKLDEKESESSLLTVQAKRIDAQTIEVILKRTLGPNVGELKTLYQVKGDILIETRTSTAPGREPIKRVINLERIK